MPITLYVRILIQSIRSNHSETSFYIVNVGRAREVLDNHEGMHANLSLSSKNVLVLSFQFPDHVLYLIFVCVVYLWLVLLLWM